jgi:pimeloyl-ACP methyl ester carboxylesterase
MADHAGAQLRLRDGRTLAWGEQGDPGGLPVVALHGTPGSRHHLLLGPEATEAAGARLIALDRPGYGPSTFHPDRTFRDFADDVTELADHLGLERFAVAGLSGGGPHALACAAFLGSRVTAVSLLSSIGPVAERGSEAGMMRANRVLTRLSRTVPAVTRVPFGLMATVGRRFPDAALARAAKLLAPPDAALLGQPEVAEAFRRDLATASRTTGRAASQDFALAARPWGFRLEDLEQPTFLWQGDEDRNVPLAHAEAMAAAIPRAVLHVIPGGGHFASVDHLAEIYTELVAASRGSGS